MNANLVTRFKNHFNDDAIIELTALIAFQNLSSKFNSALDVAAQGICSIAPSPKIRGSVVKLPKI